MPDDSAPSVLQRMAGITPPGDATQADAPAPGLDRALAEAAVLVARGLPGLELSIDGQSCIRQAREAVLADLPDACTILPLIALAGEWSGAVLLDASLTDALVEAQTLGRVEPRARKARPPTRIDASFARAFAARLLAGAVGRHGTQTLPAPDPARHMAGASALGPEIGIPSLIVAEMAITLGPDRSGLLRLLLPDRPRVALPGPRREPGGAGPGGRSVAEPRAKGDPQETLIAARLRLEATLPPLTLPLSRLLALQVGDTIPLPRGALDALRLGAGRLGSGRRIRRQTGILHGRLGQKDGARAIKLTLRGATAPAERADAGAMSGEPTGGAVTRALPAPEGSPSETAVAKLPARRETGATAAPAEAGASDLPDLPGLPDLPDLPELPDLPDLPDLPGVAALKA